MDDITDNKLHTQYFTSYTMRNVSRQKPARQHHGTNGTNAETARLYFQVTVNVLEARKLSWANPHSANSYAIVVIGKKKQRTSVRKHMMEPFYKEYFVFELYESIKNVQEQSIWLAVMEPRCCAPPRMIGEATIDLATVWRQPHHQVFHKWAQLSVPRDPAAGVVGFLKVDISMVFRGDVHVMPLFNEDNVEDNLLLPSGSEQQRANYVITIHGAFGIPRGIAGDKRGKLPSTYVKVTFCGLMAKTAVQPHTCNPMYSEQISLVEMFPNMNHEISIDVHSGDGMSRVLGSTRLSLEEISHDGENGFLPTFGPSLLQIYGPLNQGGDAGACYRGSLLVSLKTEVPYYRQALRTTSVEPVVPIKYDCLWTWEDFCIFCPILEVSMLDRAVVGKLCGVAITIGEIGSEDTQDEEFLSTVHEIKIGNREHFSRFIVEEPYDCFGSVDGLARPEWYHDLTEYAYEYSKYYISTRSRKLHYTGSIDVFKSRPAYGYLDFTNSYPVLQQATHLPDFRFRMFRNNMVHGVVSDLQVALEDIEHRLKNSDYNTPDDLINEVNKALDDAAGSIAKYLDVMQQDVPSSSSYELGRTFTELDEKQIALQKEEMGKIYRQITSRHNFEFVESEHNSHPSKYKRICPLSSRKRVKVLLSRAKSLAQELRHFIFKTSDGSPDIVVWLLSGGSRVAYTKIPVSEVIYSDILEQRGRFCGRLQTVYMKPLKCLKHNNSINSDCFCVTGKVELLLWMGLYKQISAFDTYVPSGYKIKVKENEMCLKASTVMVEYRLFVYQAKFVNCIENANFTHTFVRINTMNAVKETQVKQKSLTPVWNQVLKIYQMLFTTQERVNDNPMPATVEIYDTDMSGSFDFVGRCDIHPIVDDRQEYEYAPKLQWHDVYRGSECAGQLLISAQLLQIPETLMKSTTYGPVDETYYVSGIKDITNQNTQQMELLPDNLVPQSSTYKIDVYWWGLRDVNVTRKPCVVLQIDELTIKSDIIINKKSNVNFPNGRSSHQFEAIISELYRPPLIIKLCDNSTFGRTMFLGTNVVKNPYKYLVKWLPENQRDSSLKSTSVASSNFYPVTPILYLKTNKSSNKGSNQSLNTIKKTSINVSNWRRIFCSKEPDEEECALLPLFAKDREKTKPIDLVTEDRNERDWWMRYYCSQKNYDVNNYDGISDKITIYNSELEAQPEFSKFKDWCSTLKLYNGKKTGIPEKDEQLRCGYLKAGIIIYKWPPSSKTVAVNPQGVDLAKGYFSEYPANEPTRHVVRVYVIKALNLIAKEFTGKSDPYVVIGCGDKLLGNRNSYVPNSVNPVFGKMYEFRCTLPEDYLLTISLYDHDTIAPDELIGSTTIDLEDRVYSKHRAQVGLPREYYTAGGPVKWRDAMKPSAILEDLCLRNHIPPPVYSDANTVVLNGVEYKECERAKSYSSPSERRQNICLSLLHKWHTMPICGYHLVPEHVETRSLFNPERSGMEQGKIQLWVDIYPLNGTYIPLPVDVTPQKAEDYELRVVVWNIKGLKLKECFGKGLADIYVKAWIGSVDQVQYTDVHYRSEFGEAAFNWRMIFTFKYQYNEIVLTRTETNFSEHEERVPPILIVQVLDSEATSKEDFIGTLTLDLNSMPKGLQVSNRFTTITEVPGKMNLFLSNSIRSWWPLTFTDPENGIKVAVGMIELELTLLPGDKAIVMPVGVGRDPPSPLPEPWRYNDSCAEKSMMTLESMFRHGSIEYFIVGAIIIISLAGVVWYFEMPKQFYSLMFE